MTDADGMKEMGRQNPVHVLGRRTSVAMYKEEDHAEGVAQAMRMASGAFRRAIEEVLDIKRFDREQKDDGKRL